MDTNLHDEFEYSYDHILGKRVLIYKDSPELSSLIAKGTISRYGEKVDDSLPDFKFPKPYIYTFENEKNEYYDYHNMLGEFPSKYEFKHRLCDGYNTYNYIDSFVKYRLLFNNQTGALIFVSTVEDCSKNYAILPDGDIDKKLLLHAAYQPWLNLYHEKNDSVTSRFKTLLKKIYLDNGMQLENAAIYQNIDDSYNKPKFGVVSPFLFPDRLLPYYKVYICEQCFITSREKLVYHVNTSKTCRSYTKWLAQEYSGKYIPVLLNNQLIKETFATKKQNLNFESVKYPDDIISQNYFEFPNYMYTFSINDYNKYANIYQKAIVKIKRIFVISLEKLYGYGSIKEMILLYYAKLQTKTFPSKNDIKSNILEGCWDDIKRQFHYLNSNTKNQLLRDYQISCNLFMILVLFENPNITFSTLVQTCIDDISFIPLTDIIKIKGFYSPLTTLDKLDIIIADFNLTQGFNILFKCIRFLIQEYSHFNDEIRIRKSKKLLVSLSSINISNPFSIFSVLDTNKRKEGPPSEFAFDCYRAVYFKINIKNLTEETIINHQQKIITVEGFFGCRNHCNGINKSNKNTDKHFNNQITKLSESIIDANKKIEKLFGTNASSLPLSALTIKKASPIENIEAEERINQSTLFKNDIDDSNSDIEITGSTELKEVDVDDVGIDDDVVGIEPLGKTRKRRRDDEDYDEALSTLTKLIKIQAESLEDQRKEKKRFKRNGGHYNGLKNFMYGILGGAAIAVGILYKIGTAMDVNNQIN